VDKAFRGGRTKILMVNRRAPRLRAAKAQLHLAYFFFASPAFVFFTPRIFFALFFLSFICLRDFSTLVARPFCRTEQNFVIKNKAKQAKPYSWIVVSDILEIATSAFGAHYNW